MTPERYFDAAAVHLLGQAGRAERLVTTDTGTVGFRPLLRDPLLGWASPLGAIGTDYSVDAEASESLYVYPEEGGWVARHPSGQGAPQTQAEALAALIRSTGLEPSLRSWHLVRALERVHAAGRPDWTWLLAAVAVHFWGPGVREGTFQVPYFRAEQRDELGRYSPVAAVCAGCGEGPMPVRLECEPVLCSYRCLGRYWLGPSVV